MPPCNGKGKEKSGSVSLLRRVVDQDVSGDAPRKSVIEEKIVVGKKVQQSQSSFQDTRVWKEAGWGTNVVTEEVDLGEALGRDVV